MLGAKSKGIKQRLRRGRGLSFELHPLFLLVGILSAFIGQFLIFLTATLAALEHECAHAFCARRFGFRLDKVVLMPYGAVISGDISGISPRQELAVCIAGPLANAFTALGFAALWWLYPETYPFTDTAAYVSASLFVVNLLPAYPLDGGRILRIFLRPLGEKRARIICRIVTLTFAAAILGYFVWTCFKTPNFGALIFAALLAAGSFGGGEYARLTFTRSKNFRRGIEERRIALSADCTTGEAMRFLREDKYLVLVLFEGNEFCGELTEEELLTELEKGNYGAPLRTCLPI